MNVLPGNNGQFETKILIEKSFKTKMQTIMEDNEIKTLFWKPK